MIWAAMTLIAVVLSTISLVNSIRYMKSYKEYQDLLERYLRTR